MLCTAMVLLMMMCIVNCVVADSTCDIKLCHGVQLRGCVDASAYNTTNWTCPPFPYAWLLLEPSKSKPVVLLFESYLALNNRAYIQSIALSLIQFCRPLSVQQIQL